MLNSRYLRLQCFALLHVPSTAGATYNGTAYHHRASGTARTRSRSRLKTQGAALAFDTSFLNHLLHSSLPQHNRVVLVSATASPIAALKRRCAFGEMQRTSDRSRAVPSARDTLAHAC